VGQRTDDIRQDIERTRDDLSTSLDVLGDRVSPRRVARRRLSGVRGRLSSVRRTVMGSPNAGGTGMGASMSTAREQARGLSDRAGEAAGSAAEQIREAPEMLRQNVEGNPLAAGIIAFGAGMLFGSIVPPTSPEKRMASSMAEGLQPVVEQAQGAAQELRSGVQESVQNAAEALKDQAQGAAQNVKEQAQSATEEVKDQAQGSAKEMKEQATGAARETMASARQSS
jgi:uncharacterized protein YjbJ (UPF0337 family)